MTYIETYIGVRVSGTRDREGQDPPLHCEHRYITRVMQKEVSYEA